MNERPVLSVSELFDALCRDDQRSVPAHITGAKGCALALFAARWMQHGQRPLVILSPNPTAAQQLHQDLTALVPSPATESERCLLVEAAETSVYADVIGDRHLAQRRLSAQLRLSGADRVPGEAMSWQVAIISAGALIRRTLPSEHLRARSLHLRVGQDVDPHTLATALDETGYLRVPLVEDPGTFAIRGGIIDLWSTAANAPVRLELDGETIERLLRFDPVDQRRGEPQPHVFIPPAKALTGLDDKSVQRIRDRCDACNWPTSKTRQLLTEIEQGRLRFGAEGLLPALCPLVPFMSAIPVDARVLVDDPVSLSQTLTQTHERAEREAEAHSDRPHFDVDALHTTTDEVADWLQSRGVLCLTPSAIQGADPDPIASMAQATPTTPSIDTETNDSLRRRLSSPENTGSQHASLDPLVEQIRKWQHEQLRVVLTAPTQAQAERLVLLLAGREQDGREDEVVLASDLTPWLLAPPPRDREPLRVAISGLQRGVVAPHDGLALVTDNEIFASAKKRRQSKRASAKAKNFSDDFRSLREGDFVVHVEHGIGKYLGLVHQRLNERVVDMMSVEYRGGDKLYLPVYRLNQLQKLRGSEGHVKLDRLGGQSFARTKSRARQRARDMADELMSLYAERELARVEPTPARDNDYFAFEASFPYEETSDQLRCIEEVSSDLESNKPMDRLVCGDVGFGKTEVALRAAYRAAMAGRQVAVLCPTTVLAQQHAITFRKRLAGLPIEVAQLSRFQTKKEQSNCVAALKTGAADIVIGTHRVLSKDVHFKRLGLVIVDEEQRFGVTAKERLKNLKKNVDVLTLTATPIPRTLQMAVTGIRDLSIITTPPRDRRAVRTIVTRRDPDVLSTAIDRERKRGGQIYYVHNRIQGLAERAAWVQELAPEASVRVAHGQMSEQKLEGTMRDFIDGEFDILCSTAIVENGLDIPRCNTIIIDGAELFGLAQLYQLRGRVGRSAERAYCYLVVPPAAALSSEAKVRVETLARYTELGSGFQIASLDMEFRGAGDLLGADQSGAVSHVGFDLFCHMLNQAVHELKGEPYVHAVDPELSFDVEALLPESYIADMTVRLTLYKRLSEAHDAAEVDSIGEECEDRFGRPPPEAVRLLHMMALKTELRRLRVLGCEASRRKVVLHLNDDAPFDPVAFTALVSQRGTGLSLTPDMRLTRRFDEDAVIEDGLAAMQRLLHELAPCLEA